MTKLERLRRKLAQLESTFKYQGGRGVELADQIDNLKMDIAIEKIRQNPVTTIRLRKAIRNVMEYNWEKEEDDYRAHAAANADPSLKGHIFKDLVILETWLKRGW
jgi:hypothetical protein